MTFPCPYCGKRLKTTRGVKQHINQTPACLAKQEAELTNHTKELNLEDPLGAQSDDGSMGSVEQLHPKQAALPNKNNFCTPQIQGKLKPTDGVVPTELHARSPLRKKQRPDDTHSSDDGGLLPEDSEESTNEDGTIAKPNTKMLADFQTYCQEHFHKHVGLSKADKSSIRLMNVLKQKAPLNAYQSVLEWHLKESGQLKKHETLKDIENYSHRKTLMKRLLDRYNLKAMMTQDKTVRLPSSKAVVTIPCRSAHDCVVSLLTDPRFKASDYLFFDNNPLAKPPEKLLYLGDLNTGDAYLETYKKLITKPNQVLLPVPLYIDGAVTGQFSDLPLTALKMSLGIHNREARDRDYAWRALGFVPAVRKGHARGKRMFQETGHLEAEDVYVQEGEGEEQEGIETNQDGTIEYEAVKAQDFHTMLAAILESFIELQETGFVWDLVRNGKLHKNIEFVPFAPFVKCDTEEADLLCGKYLVRNKNVKHVCRYCHCPTDQADDPRANYPPKTQKAIKKLIDRGDLARLQSISQQYIQNAWYEVRFHVANEAGIHGACPSEKLHAIQLGIFKYIREIFFQYLGKTSTLADEINGLATVYGSLFTRQSERDLPNTNFAKGTQKGKVMARDFRGILLLIAAVLRSSKGKELLLTRKKFGGEAGLRDWTLLVELLLEWEAYLCERKMRRKDVKRLAKKHVFIMYIMRQVANRTTGMGLKVMKFHAILHLIEDMLLYGVPTEFDTGSNESHHKGSKYAAKLTQRKEETFNTQTALRLSEFLCIDLAMEEVEFSRKVWQYFDNADTVIDAVTGKIVEEPSESGTNDDPDQVGNDTSSDENEVQTSTYGTTIVVFEDEDDDLSPSFKFETRSGTMWNAQWSTDVVEFLIGLQKLVIPYIPQTELLIKTEHRRGNTIFHGHPNYRSSGRPWKDWALIDWGTGYGTLPSHIWCFVCLQNMPIGRNTLQFGGINLTDGVYAVVEVANYDHDNDEKASDLFTPLTLDIEEMDLNGEVSRKFYLANTDAIVGTCCVVPDIGGQSNSYFQVHSRAEWTNLFSVWLKAPHEHDVMDYSDEEQAGSSSQDIENEN